MIKDSAVAKMAWEPKSPTLPKHKKERIYKRKVGIIAPPQVSAETKTDAEQGKTSVSNFAKVKKQKNKKAYLLTEI